MGLNYYPDPTTFGYSYTLYELVGGFQCLLHIQWSLNNNVIVCHSQIHFDISMDLRILHTEGEEKYRGRCSIPP